MINIEIVRQTYREEQPTPLLCLYFMGLNLSNDQIAHELDVDRSDVHQMTTQLRQGIVKKRVVF